MSKSSKPKKCKKHHHQVSQEVLVILAQEPAPGTQVYSVYGVYAESGTRLKPPLLCNPASGSKAWKVDQHL